MRNYRILDGFLIRIIAIITMVIDHLALGLGLFSFLDTSSNLYWILRIIGRLSFPLFALGIVEGMIHTSNKEKYLLRLLGMLVLTSVSIYLITDVFKIVSYTSGNIFIDLFLGALIIYFLTFKNKTSLLSLLAIGVVVLIQFPNTPNFLKPSYSFYGVSLIVLLYLGYLFACYNAKLKANKYMMDYEDYKLTTYYQGDINRMYALMIILTNIIFFIICMYFPYFNQILVMSVQDYSIISIIFVILYNGKHGYSSKWFKIFNYLFYPLHLIIIFSLLYLL